jgi:hypothetical protein
LDQDEKRSMNFVYLHVVLFTVWMLFIESKLGPTLTLIVSLEAIFLSTFVMIGWNRHAEFHTGRRAVGGQPIGSLNATNNAAAHPGNNKAGRRTYQPLQCDRWSP